MKTALKLFTVAFTVLLTVSVFTVFTSAATSNAVVYISSDGTGDGSAPDKPLGNTPGFKIESGTDNQLALYNALKKLPAGGTVVIVGPVYLNTAHSRVPTNREDVMVISECRTPTVSNSAAKKIKIKITSVYNGTDYRTQGAKLVLDHDACNTGSIAFNCPIIFDGLHIEYKYDPTFMNSYNAPYLIEGYGHALEIGPDVQVTSFDTSTNSAGTRYPALIGGHRYSTVSNGTNLTINSGTWELVCGGSYGLNDSYGSVSGNINVTVNGGKIGTFVGTSSLTRPYGKYTGSLNITINGGEFNELFFVSTLEFTSKNSKVVIGEDAVINYMDYAPLNYSGDYSKLKTLINLTNENETIPGQIKNPTIDTDNEIEQEQPLISKNDVIIICAAVVTFALLAYLAAFLRKKYY